MGSIYVVLIVNLVIWSGIFFYLFRTDRAVRKLKKELESLSLKDKS